MVCDTHLLRYCCDATNSRPAPFILNHTYANLHKAQFYVRQVESMRLRTRNETLGDKHIMEVQRDPTDYTKLVDGQILAVNFNNGLTDHEGGPTLQDRWKDPPPFYTTALGDGAKQYQLDNTVGFTDGNAGKEIDAGSRATAGRVLYKEMVVGALCGLTRIISSRDAS